MPKTFSIKTVHSPSEDITFILEECEINGEAVSTEVVGFYYGQPDETLTSQYYGKLKAEYTTGKESEEKQ